MDFVDIERIIGVFVTRTNLNNLGFTLHMSAGDSTIEIQMIMNDELHLSLIVEGSQVRVLYISTSLDDYTRQSFDSPLNLLYNLIILLSFVLNKQDKYLYIWDYLSILFEFKINNIVSLIEGLCSSCGLHCEITENRVVLDDYTWFVFPTQLKFQEVVFDYKRNSVTEQIGLVFETFSYYLENNHQYDLLFREGDVLEEIDDVERIIDSDTEDTPNLLDDFDDQSSE